MRKTLIAATALTMLVAVGSRTDAAGIAQYDSPVYGNYVQQLAGEVEALTQSATGEGSLAPQFLDFGDGGATAGLASADQALVRAMARTYDLFQALGGSTDRRGVVERDGGRVYVGLDGEGGRWFSDSAAAAAFLFDELVDNSSDIPDSVRDAVAEAGADPGCGLSCVTEVAYRELVKLVAFVPRGTTVTLTLTADGYSAQAGGPVVEAPSGLTVRAVTFVDEKTIRAEIAIPGTVPTGRIVLSAFNAGDAFRPVENFAIDIVDVVEQRDGPQTVAVLTGTGTIEPLSDDHAGELADATTLSGSVTGRIESAGDVDTFRVQVDQPATLAVSTSGSTDVRLTLRDGEGKSLAADDDSGAWYNASISRVVPAGAYFVDVRHCCGGTGTYTVSATQQ
jgi:hypothetical protein